MAFLPPGMQHVERQDLYTSLRARVRFLQNFIDFSRSDLVALEEGQDVIKAAIPGIVESVYKKLLAYDVTARVFSSRDSRSEEDPDVWANNNSAAIQNRKIFLRWYLTKLNSDPTRMEYWEYLDKVGLMHVSLGRRNPLHVDYIFLGICMGHIQDAFTESIISHETLPLPKRVAVVRAVGKLIWIQNDLLARWHVDEHDMPSSEPPISITDPIQGKQCSGLDSKLEGRSKTSLGRDRHHLDNGVDFSRASSPSGCPFSGMVLDEQRAALRSLSRPGSRTASLD